MDGKHILGKIDSDDDNGHGLPLLLVDEGSSLHHGTLMPMRGFRRSLRTGKSLSFDYPEEQFDEWYRTTQERRR